MLLTSDREQMLKVKSSSSSTGAGTGQIKSSAQHGHHHHHHHGHHHQSSPATANGNNQSGASQQHQQHQQHQHKSQKEAFRKCASGKAVGSGAAVAGASGAGATNTINTTAATIRSDPDRVRLEEFTCDVSLEDGKKPQPLQFSFTLYDLDGHGKITKDDIAGIVSTIYESIGKSVVVPHYGSKTINVRLTVSPDGKTATAKPTAVKKAIVTPRRRYRSRKLLSDDDGSDTSENCARLLRNRTVAAATASSNQTALQQTEQLVQQQHQPQHHHHHHHHPNGVTGKVKETSLSKVTELACDNQANRSITLSNTSEGSSGVVGQLQVDAAYQNNLSSAQAGGANAAVVTTGKTAENVYESINNLKCCNLQQQQLHVASNNTSQATSALNQSTASTAALLCHDCVDSPTPTLLETVIIPTSAGAVGRAKRKLVRKTRSSRKTAVTAKLMAADDYAGRPRARSLSVGNENCYENVIGRVAAVQEECWKSSLCRRELIEIIRESMVKNSLCFQPNRKAIESSSPKHRHRSHTIASRVGDQVFFNYHHPTAAALMAANNGGATVVAAEHGTGGQAAATHTTTTTALVTMAAGHEANLCGYDSYLHKTICAAANGGGGAAAAMHLAAAHTTAAAINGGIQALTTSTPNRLLQHHFHHSKLKRKEHHRLATAIGTARPIQHHPTPVKLSTALLNQQYPNLSAEQKLTRSINQVEQWLDHRSPKLLPMSKVKPSDEVQPSPIQRTAIGRPLKRSKSKEDLTPACGNLLLLENLKISEDIAEIAVVTPKKVFNKESLIASATKKNIKTHQHHQHGNGPAATGASRQTAGPLSTPVVEKIASITTTTQASADANLVQLQYGSVPVNADPSECENLIRMSDDGDDEPQLTAQPTLASTRHHHRHHQHSRSQPQSPQHHSTPSHHQQRLQQQPGYCGSGGAHSVSSASAASTTAVHRYVHEHIHHHYHHFENDPDES
uniref:Protein naked cuticle homolog n=1 Tax=Anopheles farauti TaxID=69004 RepID=A0A182QBH9_9DIPT